MTPRKAWGVVAVTAGLLILVGGADRAQADRAHGRVVHTQPVKHTAPPLSVGPSFAIEDAQLKRARPSAGQTAKSRLSARSEKKQKRKHVLGFRNYINLLKVYLPPGTIVNDRVVTLSHEADQRGMAEGYAGKLRLFAATNTAAEEATLAASVLAP